MYFLIIAALLFVLKVCHILMTPLWIIIGLACVPVAIPLILMCAVLCAGIAVPVGIGLYSLVDYLLGKKK